MTILAFDCSGVTCTCCVSHNGQLYESFTNNGLTHSQTLLPEIDKCLSDAGITVSELDMIGVVTGPGSFTGVKIAVSTAKGLAYSRHIRCAGISSLMAYAYSFDGNGLLCPVMDARRNMFYNALFRKEDGHVTRICDDRQISKDEILAQANDGFKICGDGADLFGLEKSFISGRGLIECITNNSCNYYNDIEINATYLRPSQAERERNERLGLTNNTKQ